MDSRASTANAVLTSGQRQNFSNDFNTKQIIDNREFSNQLRDYVVAPVGDVIAKNKLIVDRTNAFRNGKGSFSITDKGGKDFQTVLSSPTKADTMAEPNTPLN